MSVTCSVTTPVSPPTCRPKTLSRGSGALALGIRVAGAGGMFLSQIVLARSLGVTAFGEYSLVIAWLQGLTVVAKLGLDNSSLRYVSEYVTKNDLARLHYFHREALRASHWASLAVMLGLIALALFCWRSLGEGVAPCLIVVALMIPLVALRQIQEASLRGIGLLFESQIGTVVWPWTLCLLTVLVWRTALFPLTSLAATSLHFLSVTVVFLMVLTFSRRSVLGQTGDTSAGMDSCRQQWTHTALAFLLAEILIAFKGRASIALAGMLLDRDAVGLYGAMEKFADVSILVSQSLGLVIAPQFASLYAAGRYADMRRLMWQGQILGLATTLPVACAVAFLGDSIFLLLGPGFREGWGVLIALLCSACIAAFSGPAAYVLQMTGCERTMLVITAASAATNILLSLILMRVYGLLGLGIAQMATSFVWMVGVRWSLSRHPVWQQVSADATRNPSDGPQEVSR